MPLLSEPGLRIPNMFEAALDGSFKGMYIQGEDPAQSDPDTQHVTAALAAMECVVVQDLFLNETAKYAHVFLPGSSFLENDSRPVAAGLVAGSDRYAASEFRRLQAIYGCDSTARHHLVALHERGDVPRAEARARRLRQQQRRYLRARLPFAGRVTADEHDRRIGRHADVLNSVMKADVIIVVGANPSEGSSGGRVAR